MDHGDVSYNVNAFLRSSKMSKIGCQMRFVAFGNKGEKYEIDVCNPDISINTYDSIDASIPKPVYAGSAGCPKPLFGSEFGAEEKDAPQKYETAKKRVWEIFSEVQKAYGPKADKVDLSKITQKSLTKFDDEKVACTKHLLKEYLERCLAFEEKKKDSTMSTQGTPEADPKTLPPGVRPK